MFQLVWANLCYCRRCVPMLWSQKCKLYLLSIKTPMNKPPVLGPLQRFLKPMEVPIWESCYIFFPCSNYNFDWCCPFFFLFYLFFCSCADCLPLVGVLSVRVNELASLPFLMIIWCGKKPQSLKSATSTHLQQKTYLAQAILWALRNVPQKKSLLPF